MQPLHEAAINPEEATGELHVLFAGHAKTPPVHKVGPQVLDYYLVHLVLSGRGHYRIRGKDYNPEPGEAFFIFPGELQSYSSDERDPWRYRWVAFAGIGADPLLARIGITPSHPVAKSSNLRRGASVLHCIQQTLAKGEPQCGLRAEGYLRLLLSHIHSDTSLQRTRSLASSEMEQQMEKAIRWLTVQYAQPVTIEAMAHSLGYHRTHLSTMFKRYTGMPPMRFLLKIRMEKARSLMQDERLTLQQIAASVGFADPLYFSRKFKEWYGMSPSDYREDQKTRPFQGC